MTAISATLFKFKKKCMEKKLKRLAVEYVKNARFIKRAKELKYEQHSLRKEFDILKSEIEDLEGDISSDEGEQCNSWRDITLCTT